MMTPGCTLQQNLSGTARLFKGLHGISPDLASWTEEWKYRCEFQLVPLAFLFYPEQVVFASVWNLESGIAFMFCPSCEAEYRPGFTECADCGVQLVYELPVEQPLSREEDLAADLIPVYITFNPADVMMVRSLLDAEEIIYSFQGELGKGVGIFIAPAMLYVARADSERVMEMLRDHGIE